MDGREANLPGIYGSGKTGVIMARQEKGNGIYTEHVPVFEWLEVDGKKSYVYCKYELGDDFLFRTTKSISINAKCLEACEYVRIYLDKYKVLILAGKDEIKKHKEVRTFRGEVKYYYPLEKWHVLTGSPEWYKGVKV